MCNTTQKEPAVTPAFTLTFLLRPQQAWRIPMKRLWSSRTHRSGAFIANSYHLMSLRDAASCINSPLRIHLPCHLPRLEAVGGAIGQRLCFGLGMAVALQVMQKVAA